MKPSYLFLEEDDVKVPVRPSRWYPQVGKSKVPDVEKMKSCIDDRNPSYQPPHR